MPASVPEQVMRTFSTQGSAAQTRSAHSTSSGEQAPKPSPCSSWRPTARSVGGWAWPNSSGPQEPR